MASEGPRRLCRQARRACLHGRRAGKYDGVYLPSYTIYTFAIIYPFVIPFVIYPRCLFISDDLVFRCVSISSTYPGQSVGWLVGDTFTLSPCLDLHRAFKKTYDLSYTLSKWWGGMMKMKMMKAYTQNSYGGYSFILRMSSSSCWRLWYCLQQRLSLSFVISLYMQYSFSQFQTDSAQRTTIHNSWWCIKILKMMNLMGAGLM